MRSKLITDILAGISHLNMDDSAKREVKDFVRSIGLNYGIRAVDLADRVAYAQKLLAQHVSRATVRDRLMACYEISRRQAYRIIDTALNNTGRSSDNT